MTPAGIPVIEYADQGTALPDDVLSDLRFRPWRQVAESPLKPLLIDVHGSFQVVAEDDAESRMPALLLKLGLTLDHAVTPFYSAIAGSYPISSQFTPTSSTIERSFVEEMRISIAAMIKENLSLSRQSFFERFAEVQCSLVDLLETGRKELSDDETEGRFADKLLEFISAYQLLGVHALEVVLERQYVDHNLASDILAKVGEAVEPKSHSERLRMLTRYLSSPVPLLRYGAAVGLAALRDPEAIPEVEARLRREQDRILRSLLAQVEEYLSGQR